MKTRDSVLDRFKKYQARIWNQFQKRIQRLRCNNAKEFVQGEFRQYLDEQDIMLEPTAPYSPTQNGVAERLNCVLVKHARVMLIKSGLPKLLWEDAVAYACYLKNRSPICALNGKTPHEVLWSKKPNLTTVREFGSKIWVLKPDTNLDKLDPKSEKFVYTGPGEGGHAWRYYNARTRQILTSRNVMFQSRAVPEPVVPEIPAPRLEGENSPASTENKPSAQDNDTAIQSQTPDNATPPSEQRHSLRALAQIDYREVAGYKVRKKVAPSDVAQVYCIEVYHALPDKPQSVAEIKSHVDWLQ
jgi:hypothetical protein